MLSQGPAPRCQAASPRAPQRFEPLGAVATTTVGEIRAPEGPTWRNPSPVPTRAAAGRHLAPARTRSSGARTTPACTRRACRVTRSGGPVRGPTPFGRLQRAGSRDSRGSNDVVLVRLARATLADRSAASFIRRRYARKSRRSTSSVASLPAGRSDALRAPGAVSSARAI